jgi:hypothetical protein
MNARFPGKCREGNDAIEAGQTIVRGDYGWVHPGCRRASLGRDLRSRPMTADEAEYQKGLADGRRYQDEKRVYGAALAEAFAAQDEFNRYWKYGED